MPVSFTQQRRVAVAREGEEILESLLLDAVGRRVKPEMRDGVLHLELAQRRHQLAHQPPRREEVELPADLGEPRVEPLDARQELRREPRLVRLDRRHVDAHAAHARARSGARAPRRRCSRRCPRCRGRASSRPRAWRRACRRCRARRRSAARTRSALSRAFPPARAPPTAARAAARSAGRCRTGYFSFGPNTWKWASQESGGARKSGLASSCFVLMVGSQSVIGGIRD